MDEPIADAVVARLAVHLGPHVAKMTVRSFAKKAGIDGQEKLTRAHLPKLIAEIRPMLNVMIGKGPGESVVADIERLGAHASK